MYVTVYVPAWTACMQTDTHSHIESHKCYGCVLGMHVTLHYCVCMCEYMNACVCVCQCVLVAVISLLSVVSQGALVNVLQAFGVLNAQFGEWDGG